MSDIASLVQKYLPIAARPKRLNYYTVLGLEELIDDRTRIASAVDSAIEKLQAADRQVDPQGFGQIVKVVRQARATLLDDEKKRAYDQQLKKSLSKTPSSTLSDNGSSIEWNRLSRLLPQGDPNEPFSMSNFLQQPIASVEVESVAARHAALAELIRSSMQPIGPTQNAPYPSKNRREGLPNFLEATPAAERPAAGRNSGRELQEMIRRNRQRKNMLAAGVAIGSSLLVVLIGVWMFVSNQMEHRQQLTKFSPLPTIEKTLPPEPEKAESSGSADVVTSVPKATASPRMNLGIVPRAVDENLGPLPKIGADDQPMTASSQISDPSASQPAPMAQEMAKTPEVIPEPKMPDQESLVKSADMDTKKWSESMNSARQCLHDRDFQKFAIDIEDALRLSSTDIQQEQAKRLDKFGQLYEKGTAIVSDALSALQPADEIKYGSAGGKASVVEAKGGQLILRISGKNEKFSFDEIPMGILMAVIEPKLNESAIDQAIRGILLSNDSRSNSATKKQAQAYFEKAASMDESLAKLNLVMQETYP